MRRPHAAALAVIAAIATATAGDAGAQVAPDDAVARALAAAGAARRSGDRAGELAQLTEVIGRDPAHSAAHARLAEMTGPAARRELPPDGRIDRAAAHPYDPWALLRAAEVWLARGEPEPAAEHLERAVWLADVDPVSALDALVLLREIDPRWRARRVVPVHAVADAAYRAQPGWRFALRTLLLSASNSLDAVLSTRFVPISLAPVELDDVANDLDAMHAALVARAQPPEEGVLAGVTGRAVPDDGGAHKKGVAEFLGRDLLVRVAPGAHRSRVLAHEILHLYGAIHVLDGVESLMNPTGTSLSLDAASIRIVRSMRTRRFAAGGIERNVMPEIDLRDATDAYVEALGINLALRDGGLAQARPEVMALDAHLADASRLVAALMVADGRREDAAHLLELAASLYGRDAEKSRRARADAQALRDSAPASAGD